MEGLVEKRKPKIVACVPVHATDRDNITSLMIESLRSQTISVEDIVIVGSREENRKLAEKEGCIYVEHPNSPLSLKYQAGIDKVRTLDPDYVLLMGSDDLLSPLYCEKMISEYKEGLIGTSVWYVARKKDGKYQLLKVSYTHRKDPIGSGRILSRETLDKLDWKLYRDRRDKGLDGSVASTLMKEGIKVFSVEVNNAICMSVKGGWRTLSSWEDYAKNTNHIIARRVGRPEDWIQEHFPKLKSRLDSLLNDKQVLMAKRPSKEFDWDDVQVTIINRGTLDVTPLCLSFRKYVSKTMQIHIIDNGSTRKTSRVLKRLEVQDPYISVDYFEEEIPYVEAADYAIRNSGFPYLLFLDSQTKVMRAGLLKVFSPVIQKSKKFYSIGRVKYFNKQVEEGKINRVSYLDMFCVMINGEEYLNHPPFTSSKAYRGGFMVELAEGISKLRQLKEDSSLERCLKRESK